MTIKTLVALGVVANDGTGDQPRPAGIKLSAPWSKTYVATAQQFGGATKEATITNAISAAFTDGATGVLIPQKYDLDGTTMVPFNGSLVTFNPAVHMMVEGEDPSIYAVAAYGAAGDGTTDDTAAINAADANAPAGAVVKFMKGATHAITTISASKFLKLNNAHRWDLNGATVKYTGVTDVTTGSDGGSLSMIVVLKNNVHLMNGTLDGNTHLAYPMSIQGALVGPTQLTNITIQNTKETSSSWNGIAFTSSVDQSGIAITSARAQNVSGTLVRPNCPVVNLSNVITGHQQVGAVLIGGSSVWGNATGTALVDAGGTESTVFVMTNGTSAGVPAFFGNQGTIISNIYFKDWVVYDLGTRHQERYGAVLDVPQRQSFSGGGAYTPGWLDNSGGQDCNVHVITVTANVAVTIANPTNPAAISVDRCGELVFIIRNTSGGGLGTAVTFTGSAYRVSGTVAPANNQQIVVRLIWDQTNSTYIEMSRGAAVAI